MLADRRGALVVRVGDLAVKAHRADKDPGELGARLRAAAHPALRDVLVVPLGEPARVAGRLVSVWPYGAAVSPDDPPWEEAGRILARLHALPADALDPPPPYWGGVGKAARTVGRLPGGPAATEIRRAFATLPGWLRGEAPPPPGTAIIHGDWHLGQLVRPPGQGWRLIDVDDLGWGDPAWDLARAAALFSAGVLPPDEWARFLGAYRAAGGRAVPGSGDPWTTLDIPARTLAIQIAATSVLYALDEGRPLDEFETALVDTCSRITRSEVGP
ncbi:aminoglycoside phosphotransferase family protein [Actinomadura craniellae]|uniref:Aminoglycoside phosphotransferase family protein n=1 Tax=Actinomadura craniellae TaxID=2231787 RepID=A0A365GY33_9ACTN|nr:aminoglycoside phosphotransferase family protein [Actinomadura craniellae]